MAHPQPQYPPGPFSPAQPAPQQLHGSFLPPAKRQRLSPNPQSPYTSPGMTNIALPNQVFSSHYYGGQPNGQPANTPSHSPAPAGTMGPPSKPPASDKPTDMNELSDVLTGAGVDLKEEEAALTGRYNAPNQYQDTSFNTGLSNSFGSTGSSSTTHVPNGTYSQYSQNVPGDRSSFYGAGSFNQPAQPYQNPEVRAAEERARALRRKAERKQYHMNDPFLFGGTLHRRLDKQAKSMHVMISQAGLMKPENSKQSTQMIVAGPDKQEMLSTLTGQNLLALDSPLTEILTLLSLATQERIRGFVEDAATIARGRRVGSNGIVPADLKDLAVGDGVPEEVDALPTPGNSATSPKSTPLKRSYSSQNGPPTPTSSQPAKTYQYPNPIAAALHKIALADRLAEEARNEKRARRATAEIISSGGTDPTRSGSVSSAVATPNSSFLGETAPEVDTKKVPSRKQQRKDEAAKATEAQQHAAANKTMNMQLGGGVMRSWMTKGAGGGGGGVLPRSVASGPKLASSGGSGRGASGAQTLGGVRKWGEWREDKESGKGIQLRDMIAVLEGDGKENKALTRAYGRRK